MTRQEVFAYIKEIGIIPAIRPTSSNEAVLAAEAICRGGIPVIEISMAMPVARQSIEAVATARSQDILVGAGTVTDIEGVRQALSSGARFIVTSGFDAGVTRTAREFDLPVLAGALTPTEVQMAACCGADAVKLFPCYAVGGPRYVKSMHGQYPKAELIASGGVTLEDCLEYLRAGACAIGVGGEIGYAESTTAGDHRVFTERARRFRKAVCEARALLNGVRQR
ncbi:MAG: 2-dehydro-3-deoxyphosphogluconate aldolase [Acidobacteriaceae bacterium]|nr:2-dehydro-3-deoxyphosphogluconate aldolase [Acidobacteriaceae bacterium]